MGELTIKHEHLSVDLHAVPLDAVLEDLSRKGGIAVTVLNAHEMSLALITERFCDKSMEEGLQRLLAQWNYGLTRHHLTGQVLEVFVVSRRINMGTASTANQLVGSLRSPRSAQGRFPNDRSSVASLPEGENENTLSSEPITDFDRNRSGIDASEFSQAMLPENLTFELREELLRDLAAHRETR